MLCWCGLYLSEKTASSARMSFTSIKNDIIISIWFQYIWTLRNFWLLYVHWIVTCLVIFFLSLRTITLRKTYNVCTLGTKYLEYCTYFSTQSKKNSSKNLLFSFTSILTFEVDLLTFSLVFTHEKRHQINVFHQNFSAENTYLICFYFLTHMGFESCNVWIFFLQNSIEI